MQVRTITAFVYGLAMWGMAPLFAQSPTPISIIRSQHLRWPLTADVQRLAVGDGETLSAEAINSRELLLLGKGSGRTSLLIWLHDGTVQEFVVTVHRDLSMLEAALRAIHPSIRAELAPDRDAVILTGLVPDVTYSRGAERVAQDYMGATRASGRVLVLDSSSPQPAAAPSATPAAPPGAPVAPDSIRVPASSAPSGTVINMIRVESLPPLAGDKVLSAIADIGGRQVKVRRVMKGDVQNDQQDVFILEGKVANQVALTRVLTVAAQILTGQTVTEQDIRVVADEAGALTSLGAGANSGASANNNAGGGVGIGLPGGLSGRLNRNLTNQVRRNVARAKVLEAAGGRILSVIEVSDIPQVRVAIRLMELNRAKLKTYAPNLAATLGSRHVGSFNAPNLGGARLAGPAAAVENVLTILGGSLVHQMQVTAGKFALDTALSFLEQQSIARTLSAPSLTVLSGEQAQFQVGGTVPVPESFSPALGGTEGVPGVFNSVTFLDFGISLNIRPLVGDDDTVTLDLAPVITAPDTTLTAALRQTTGTNQLSTAFLARSLRTSARLQDGQALLIGGLLTNTIHDGQSSTPGVRDVPGLGWLFKNLNRTDDSTELVMVVDPVIVRDPLPDMDLWEFPSGWELMQEFRRRIPASHSGERTSEIEKP